MSRAVGRAGVLASLVLGTIAGIPSAALGGTDVWSLASDGSWDSSVVSLGGGAERVLTHVGVNSGSYMMFSTEQQDPPVAVMEEDAATWIRNVMLDSAVDVDSHVSSHQRKSELNTNKWRTTLTGYDSAGAKWEFMFAPETSLYPGSGVAISSDGSVVAGALWSSTSGSIEVVVLSGDSGSLSQAITLPPAGQLKDLAMSADGSTMVLASALRLFVLDLSTGSVLHSESIPGQPSYGALDISGDGEVFAYGTFEKVKVYRRAGGGYDLALTQVLPALSACRRLAVSPDGRTLAYGLHFLDQSPRVDIRAYDLDSGQMTMQFESAVPGTLLNTINGIEITDDGTRFAVGMYGDEQHSLPEILVFDVDNDQPVLTIDRPGSILDLDMSGDGTKLAVATKGEHYTIGGGLGSVDLFDISTDSAPAGFSFVGQPTLGSVIRFEHDLEGGNYGRVFASEFLDSNPTVFGSIGTLYLDRSRLDVVPVGALNNTGQMITPFQVQGVQAGTTLYFQALAVGPRKLTENYIELTVLP